MLLITFAATHKYNAIKHLIAGFVFAVLWGSASTATKYALELAQPFTISFFRFLVAAIIMLAVAHFVLKQPFPAAREWKKLMIYGFLNITVYLGFFIIAMQYISAGIAALFIATNPVFIAIMSALWLKQPVKLFTVVSLLICSAGILLAAYPLLHSSYVTPVGLLIILLSMISYSIASVYFTEKEWSGMHMLTINGWQTFFGTVFTAPLFLFFLEEGKNSFHYTLVASILWLAIPVSIGAVLLWMYMLKEDPVKASFWLFLCPIFGIVFAAKLLHEPVSWYTAAGVALVLAGLYIVNRIKKGTIKTATAATD